MIYPLPSAAARCWNITFRKAYRLQNPPRDTDASVKSNIRYISNMRNKMIFREATPRDRSEVLSMRQEVYRGLDYLPDYYDFFIKDRNRLCIVGEKNAKIVTFGVLLTLDGGQSILSQAGRVHEDFERRGYFSGLSRYINHLSAEKGCRRRVALVETSLNKYARSEKFRKTHTHIASKLHYAGIITSDMRPVLEKTLSHVETLFSDISEVGLEDLNQYISTDRICKTLFPQDRLLIDYVPYRAMADNLELLHGRNTRFYSNIIEHENDVTGLLSAGTIYRSQNPPVNYTVDIFGSDERCLELHVLFHIWRALHDIDTSREFCLQFFVEKGYIAQVLCEILLKLNVPKCNKYVEGGVTTKTIVEERFDTI